MSNVLVVGAGLTGAVVACELKRKGIPALVIDRREHIAGNCYDEMIDGIRANRYGGHIFHTFSKRIWDYASRYTEWEQYEHRVKVNRGGVVYSFPPNKMTFQQLGLSTVDRQTALNVLRERFFREYSEKQWGRAYEEIPECVIKRIPIRDTWDDRYFEDTYQGLPADGYTALVASMLDGVPVELGTSFADFRSEGYSQIVYTGRIDQFFGFDLGELEYRSLEFKTLRLEVPSAIGCATMNFPEKRVAHTKIMEWKYFWRTPSLEHTVITFEVPKPCRNGREPYYPVDDQKNRALYSAYARRLPANVIPAGRLGRFQYINMDQAIGGALKIAEELTG